MDTLYRSGFLGDQIVLTLPLKNADGTEFVPGSAYALIFTAKNSDQDPDSAAVIQLTSGAGVVHDDAQAVCTIHPDSTKDLSSRTLVFDIQAQHLVTGQVVRTVAFGRLNLSRDITRETTTSVPVVTTDSPLPLGPYVTVTAGDELEIVSGGITYYVPLYRRS